MYSVDINSEHCQVARDACSLIAQTVEVVQSESVKFLKGFNKGVIDFLYLDSFDYDEDNPDPSQEQHLKEIEAAYDKLHRRSVVMIDNCRLPYEGKCRLVKRFLERRGWKLKMNKYQQIFVYEE